MPTSARDPQVALVSLNMIAHVIFAHGSPIESANEAVRVIAAEAARAGGFELCEAAFLERGTPSLPEAIASLAARGASEIIVIPYFLTLGLHLQRDLPQLIRAAQAQTPGVGIRVTEPLDGHPALSAILVDRARGERS
jgi:sirohydrochlorin ferrochelatase